MNTLSKTLIASVATVIALSAPAFAALSDVQDFNVNAAKLDYTLDTDGNGTITDDEIIDGNVAAFDVDGSGRLDAEERGVAEIFVEQS